MFIRFILKSCFHGTSTFRDKAIQNGRKFSLISGVEFSFLSDLVQQLGVVSPQVSQELGLELGDL